MSLKDPLTRVAAEAAVGYMVGRMGFISTPATTAVLAMTIAIVKEVTKGFFKNKKEYDVVWGIGGRNTFVSITGAGKLTLDLFCGVMAAEAAGAQLGMRFARLPTIQVMAFAILVDLGRNVLFAGVSELNRHISTAS